jgi:hypothetical protein
MDGIKHFFGQVSLWIASQIFQSLCITTLQEADMVSSRSPHICQNLVFTIYFGTNAQDQGAIWKGVGRSHKIQF